MRSTAIAIAQFVLSTKSLERGDPLHYLKSLSLLIMSNSDILNGLKTIGSFKLRRKRYFGQQSFGERSHAGPPREFRNPGAEEEDKAPRERSEQKILRSRTLLWKTIAGLPYEAQTCTLRSWSNLPPCFPLGGSGLMSKLFARNFSKLMHSSFICKNYVSSTIRHAIFVRVYCTDQL